MQHMGEEIHNKITHGTFEIFLYIYELHHITAHISIDDKQSSKLVPLMKTTWIECFFNSLIEITYFSCTIITFSCGIPVSCSSLGTKSLMNGGEKASAFPNIRVLSALESCLGRLSQSTLELSWSALARSGGVCPLRLLLLMSDFVSNVNRVLPYKSEGFSSLIVLLSLSSGEGTILKGDFSLTSGLPGGEVRFLTTGDFSLVPRLLGGEHCFLSSGGIFDDRLRLLSLERFGDGFDEVESLPRAGDILICKPSRNTRYLRYEFD